MGTRINEEILEDNDPEFNREYLELLVSRLTHSSMSLELDLGNPDESKNAIKVRDNMKAFKNLINNYLGETKISEHMIIETANKINESAYFISDNYRKNGAKYIADSKVPITPAFLIEDQMKSLVYNYNNNWNDLDVFEKEAKFHIEFILIHPFEDGNGRTGRLIMNYNLLRQGIAPVIITSDLIEYYHQYIKDSDISSMANLFKIQSTRENEIINFIHNEYKEKNKKVI
ncbi:MAG: Fic family protein [Bacilli bacterium]|nr:Fic family protein [Bacilli bacterium]